MANSIVISLKARSAAFSRSMQRASKRLSSFGKGIGRIGAKVAKFGAIAGGAAAVGVAYLGKRSIDAMDATGKLADRLGVSTEAITSLRHAAELSGVSAGTLDKSLEVLTRRLGEAKQGLGQAKNGLDSIGLSAKSLESMNTQEQMLAIADGISQLPTQAQRAAAAYQLFGRQGQQMLNMLQGGKGNLSAMMAEAEELGLTFNRLDASYAERINDSMQRLKGVVGGAWRSALVSVLPPITAIMEKLVMWGKSIMPWLGATVSTIIGGIQQTWGILKTYMGTIFEAIGNILASFGISFSGTGDIVGSVVDTLVGFLKWLATQSIKVITMIEIGFTSWKQIAELSMVAIVYSIVWLGNTIVHWIGTVIPDLLSWFGRNWKELFTDMASLVATIFKNMWKNIKSFFSNLWKALKGEKTKWEFTSLTAGFEATLSEMPKIAERKLGETEKQLKSRMSNLGKSLSDEYEKKVSERLAKLDDNTKKPKKVGKELAKKQKEILKKNTPAIAEIKKDATQQHSPANTSMSKGPGEFKVIQSSRMILQPSRKENKAADATQKTAKNTGELVSLMRDKELGVAFV